MLGKNLSNLSDEELFLQYIKGSGDDFFRELYQRYSGKVYAYCMRASVTKEAARDNFQKTWIAIIENKEKFTGGCFIAWLMIITRNNCLMEKRARKPNDEFIENEIISNDDNKIDFEMNKLLHVEINKLPEELSEVVKLRYFDGFSYKQISDILGVSLSLVKVRLHRAKKALTLALEFLRKEQ